MAGAQPTGFLAKRKTTKKDAGTFSPILDKEQGGYEALLGRPWLQPGWFMTGLIKTVSSRERRDGKRKRLGFVSQKKD
jgi:hypothetical protein